MKNEFDDYLREKSDFEDDRISYLPERGNPFGRDRSQLAGCLRPIAELIIGFVLMVLAFATLGLVGMLIFSAAAAYYVSDRRNTAATTGEALRQQEANELFDTIEKRFLDRPPLEKARIYEPRAQVDELTSAIEAKKRSKHVSLYLRPFDSTDRFQYRIDKEMCVVKPDEDYKDLERRIAEGLEDIAPMYALGRPGEHLGARRLKTSEESWRLFADELINFAVPVFVVPSANPGTMWEIERIRELGALPKTIFIMPRWDYLEERDFSDYWTDTSEKLVANLGLKLPIYHKEGAWIRFDDEWNVQKIVPDLHGDYEVHYFTYDRSSDMQIILPDVFLGRHPTLNADFKNIVSHSLWESYVAMN